MTEFPDAEYVILSSRLIPDMDGGYTLATLARARQMAAAGVHGGRGPLLLTVDPGTAEEHARHRAAFDGRDLIVDPSVMRNLFDEAAGPDGGARAVADRCRPRGRARSRAAVPRRDGCRIPPARRPAGHRGRSRLAHQHRARRRARRGRVGRGRARRLRRPLPGVARPRRRGPARGGRRQARRRDLRVPPARRAARGLGRSGGAPAACDPHDPPRAAVHPGCRRQRPLVALVHARRALRCRPVAHRRRSAPTSPSASAEPASTSSHRTACRRRHPSRPRQGARSAAS